MDIVRHRTEDGCRTAIVEQRTAKRIALRYFTTPLTVRWFPMDEERHMTPLADYPERRAHGHLNRAQKHARKFA